MIKRLSWKMGMEWARGEGIGVTDVIIGSSARGIMEQRLSVPQTDHSFIPVTQVHIIASWWQEMQIGCLKSLSQIEPESMGTCGG